MPINWDYAARIVWSILTSQAKRRQTITYGEIAPKIQTNPRNVRKALAPIQDFCLDTDLPPLTAIVVGVGGKPGRGFIAWDIDDLATAHTRVFDKDWSEIRNPYGQFAADDSEDSLAAEVVNDPDKAADVFVKVRARGVAQRVFKKIMLRAYNNQCAFCGLTFDDALQGCHILPWNQCSRGQRLDPRNGLLLCASHHCLFDAGLITVSRSFKIAYRDMEMKDEPYSEIDKELDRRHWPSPELLMARHKDDGWGSLP
jgi:putative restriction endonuclease